MAKQKKTLWQEFTKGIIKENPVLRLVLGVTMLVIDNHTASPETYGFLQALVNAFGSGIGFLVAMVLFAGVRERLETCDIPKCLRGLPITLIAASLVSVSFLGFQGLVDGLLG